MHRSSVLVLCACVVALFFGCASQSPTSATATALPQQADGGQRIAESGQRGLEVRQWLIGTDSDVIADAMLRHGSIDAVPEEIRNNLRRNGLRCVRIALDDLASLEHDLGGATLSNVGWHGQLFDWQEVISRPLSHQRAFAIDGRIGMLHAGAVRLMGRSWIAQTEDGLRLAVQIVPQHRKPEPMGYYRLLGRDTTDTTVFPSMAVEWLMQDGYAYVLTCEAPSFDWRRSDNESHDDDAATNAPIMTGPDVAGPTTLGQFLLMSEYGSWQAGARGFLILIPRIAEKR